LHKTPPPPAIAPPPGPAPLPTASAEAPKARLVSESPVLPPAPLATQAAPPPPAQAAASPQDGDPHKAFGSKSAPVVMEEFSDYQCPACKRVFTTPSH